MKRYVTDILMVVPLSLPLTFAPSKRVYMLARAIHRRGCSITLVGTINLSNILIRGGLVRLNTTHKSHHFREMNIIPVIYTRSFFVTTFLNLFILPIQILTIILLILILKPRLIYFTSPPTHVIIPLYIVTKIFKKSLIIDVRDPEEYIYVSIYRGFMQMIAKIFYKLLIVIYRSANLVTVVTEGIKSIYKKQGIQSIVIPTGTDLIMYEQEHSMNARFSNYNIGIDLVFNGSISAPYYELGTILKALVLAKRKRINARMIILGDNICNHFSNIESVKCLGYLTGKEYVKALTSAHIGVIPRTLERAYDYAIPAKFYDYIAAGLPVLALCRFESLLATYIRIFNLGWICRPGDYVCVFQVLERVSSNKQEYVDKKLSVLKFRQAIDSRFHAKVFADLVEGILRKGR